MVVNGDPVVWHELECGSYTADLALWRELATAASAVQGTPGAVLDVGAGTGRVTLELACRGHAVTALDLDERLLAALRQRAVKLSVSTVETVCADARAFTLERRQFSLCIVPMQTIQLLGGSSGRRAFFERARAHLAPGGVLACAIVTDVEPFDCAAGDPGPIPEQTRVGGVSYLSRPTALHLTGDALRIERERSIVESGSTQGARLEHDVIELARVSVDRLHREGLAAGLTPAPPRTIAATFEHTASTAVIFHG
ncbi:MAG TPA: class I SAM-dependent methyltransferase [Solirubrobacteraceae bacterium]|jgi:SAM-dependent methyltransferase|nr:class I SAM-dependent methyltransferase [Solirubrobacteraceae bacterium]